MNTQKFLKNGFTLAEVLITLVIIGVIAAMTVPTLMKNTQNQEFVSGVKKANSTLSQALINITNNNDSTAGDYSFLSSVDFIDELAKVTNVIKKCNNTTQCFGSDLNHGSVYKSLHNQTASINSGKSAILSDGQILTFATSFGNTYGLSSQDNTNCLGRIAIDINGNKGPNIVGRDTFLFYIVNEKGIVPAGSNSSSDCVKTGAGYTCTAKVLKENAMNY